MKLKKTLIFLLTLTLTVTFGNLFAANPPVIKNCKMKLTVSKIGARNYIARVKLIPGTCECHGAHDLQMVSMAYEFINTDTGEIVSDGAVLENNWLGGIKVPGNGGSMALVVTARTECKTHGCNPADAKVIPIPAIFGANTPSLAMSQHRGIDIHGLPMAGKKPQQEEEIDQPQSMFEINAKNLLPSYSVTDISIPIGGAGDLKLEFRRSNAPSKKKNAFGFDTEDPNYSHPMVLGNCWNTNILCRAMQQGTLNVDTGVFTPSGAIIYDENGAEYNYGPDGEAIVHKFSDAAAAQSSIEWEGDTLVWKKKFGTIYRFSKKVSLPGVDNFFSHYLSSITDRNGNVIEYIYGETHNFPIEIRDKSHPEIKISISYVAVPDITPTQYRISSVSDPLGNTYIYEYDTTNTYLTKVKAPAVPVATGTEANPGNATPVTEFSYGSVVLNSYEFDHSTTMLVMTSMKDPKGNTISLEYQKFVNAVIRYDELILKKVTSIDGEAEFAVLASGLQEAKTQITDTKDNVWTYTFTEPMSFGKSGSFLKTSRKINDGNEVVFEYNVDEESKAINLTLVTDQHGNKYQYVYGTVDGYNHSKWNNAYQEISDPDTLQITKTFGYDETHNLMNKIISPRGNTTSYILDGAGNRTKESGPLGKELNFTYDGTGFMTQSTDPDGRVTQFSRAYSPTGWVDTTTVKGYNNELNISSSKSYNLRGDMISSTDANSKTTTYTYDGMGSLVKVTKPQVYDTASQANVAAEIIINRDANRQFVAKRNERGVWTAYNYDGLYRLISKAVDPAGLNISTSMTYDANGNRASMTDPRGTATTFEYDDLNRLTKETFDPNGLNLNKTYAYGENCGNDVFGDSGYLPTSITDRKGIVEEFVYDTAYRLTTKKRAGLTLSTMEYDASGNVTKITNNNTTGNQVIDNVYDALERKTQTTVDAAGLNIITKTEYDLAGNVTAVVDPENKRSETIYDGAGRAITQKIKMTGGNDIVSNSTYDGNGNVLTSTLINDNGSGNQTSTSTYDAWNRVLTVTDPEGKVESVKYDLASNKTEVIDKNNNVSTMEYDNANRLTTTTLPQVADAENGDAMTNPVISQTYDQNSNVLTATDARGIITTNVYDKLNRVTSTTADSAGIAVETAFTYDANSNKLTETLKRGDFDLVTTFTYDDFNRVAAVTDALNHTESYSYDTIGNKLSVTDKRSNATNFVYDKANRLVKTKLPEVTCYTTGNGTGTAVRPETTTVYLKNGWVSSVTDANGKTSSTVYDDAGRKTKVTNAAGDVIDYTYDKAGNILTQIVRNGDFSGDQTTAFVYDKRNLLLTETLMPSHATLERTTAYSYDNMGNKATRTFPDSASTVYSYDALNRLILESYTGATGENRSYKYNLNGAVIEAVDASGKTIYAYDALGRITSETKKDLSDNSLSVVSSQYDKAGNRTQVTYPGNKTLTFAYDKRNLLSTVTDATDVTAYGYDENGNRVSLALPNGVVTTTAFDPANRVTQLKNEDSTPANIYTTDYRMDKVGNRIKITETRPSGTRNLIYTYDNVYRLLTESDDITGTAVTTTYTFDDAGNRLTKADGTTTWTYSIDQLNRVVSFSDGTNTTAYTYDVNGNRLSKNDGTVTHNYVYDCENRLVSVNDGAADIFNAVYDYRTRRMSKVENSTTTNYVYDGGVNVQELDSARSLTKQLVRGTGMGGGIGSVLYNEDASASNREFFCYTAIGSVVAMTDSTGTVTSTTSYEAFGKEVASTGSTSENRKFCTKERDASIGLDNFGFRYYDADLGRFTTRDPAGQVDGPNVYLYCKNNPINHIDPLGLEATDRDVQDPEEFIEQVKVFLQTKPEGSDKTWGEHSKRDQMSALKDEIWKNNAFTSKNNSGKTATSGGATSLSGNTSAIDKEKLGWRYIGYKKDGKENFLDLGHFTETMNSSIVLGDNLTLLGGDLVEYYQGVTNFFGIGLTANQTSAFTGEDPGSNQAGVDFKNDFLTPLGKYHDLPLDQALNSFLKDMGAVKANEARKFENYKVPGYSGLPKDQGTLDDNHSKRSWSGRQKIMGENFSKNAPTGSMAKHASIGVLDLLVLPGKLFTEPIKYFMDHD